MKLCRNDADVFIPDGQPLLEGLSRTTHLGIVAHQDDLEIIAYDAIEACYGASDHWFGGIVVTDGVGSARQGPYAGIDDEMLRTVRRDEQRNAARVGRYGFVAQLGYPSKVVCSNESKDSVADLESLLRLTRPRVLYLHNPADKHDTHIAVLCRCIEALKRLDPKDRPETVLGVEVWRNLDWVLDADKIPLRTDRRPSLAAALLGVFDSQISGGKRYDRAIDGRRAANATFFAPGIADTAEGLTFALDLTPLIGNDGISLASFTEQHLDAFRQDVLARIGKYSVQAEN